MLVKCQLCPKGCGLREGERGECRVRANLDGKLTALTYGRPCSVHVDPIEKKPFFHFYPGWEALSLSTAGCNLSCLNCQNWDSSQADPENIPAYKLDPEDLVAAACEKNIPIIAYTYTDPVAYYEYTLDSCAAARARGLKNALVTAGYINRQPLKSWCEVVDAIKIDLKFFDDALYRKITTATLAPVLDTLVTIKEMGVWLEIVNLVIPTLNDGPESIKNMCRWIKNNLGQDVPLHFSRFYPQYKLVNLPSTPAQVLKDARRIALDEGLRFVYTGNISDPESESTYCPYDGTALIRRDGYHIEENNINKGKCPACGNKIPGVWQS